MGGANAANALFSLAHCKMLRALYDNEPNSATCSDIETQDELQRRRERVNPVIAWVHDFVLSRDRIFSERRRFLEAQELHRRMKHGGGSDIVMTQTRRHAEWCEGAYAVSRQRLGELQELIDQECRSLGERIKLQRMERGLSVECSGANDDHLNELSSKLILWKRARATIQLCCGEHEQR